MCLVAGALRFGSTVCLHCSCKGELFWTGVSSELEHINLRGRTATWCGILGGRPPSAYFPCKSLFLGVLLGLVLQSIHGTPITCASCHGSSLRFIAGIPWIKARETVVDATTGISCAVPSAWSSLAE